MMHFIDRAPISGTKRTSDGYLTTVARSVRTGVQLYAGHEVGRPEMDVVRVYRPASEVMSQDSLQSFSHAPITMDHPTEAVTADNWKKLSVGEVSTAAKVDDDGWVQLPLVLKDSAAIAAIESGKRELSAGYTTELVWEDGDGYDAIQTNIRINHLAIVDKARAGSDARIGDNWGARPILSTDKKETAVSTKNVMVDGLSVETTEQGAQAIAKLTADRDGLSKQLADALAANDKALADKDAEIAKKDAEIDSLKAKVLDDAALDKAVTERADLIAKAKGLAPKVVTDGKSALDIKRAVLTERKVALDGKSEAYIEARFDTLVEDNAEADKTAGALGDSKVVTDAEADAHARMVRRMKGEKE